jgi:hypothetical protein
MCKDAPAGNDLCHIGRRQGDERIGRVAEAIPRERRMAGKGEAVGNQSLTDEERMQIESRIAALEIEHQDLNDVIARLSEHPTQDQLQLRRFKKRKLVLKDSISRLKILLVPDIPA